MVFLCGTKAQRNDIDNVLQCQCQCKLVSANVSTLNCMSNVSRAVKGSKLKRSFHVSKQKLKISTPELERHTNNRENIENMH